MLSKLYFHLEDYDRSVAFALQAGRSFNIEERSQFAETILAAIIDKYTSLRTSGQPDSAVEAFEDIITRVVQRCLNDHQLEQLIGMSLEARRLDVFQVAIESAANPQEAASLLRYARKAVSNLTNCIEFRGQVLNKIVELFAKQPSLDYTFVCDCLINVNQPEQVAQVISLLLTKSETIAQALQICFNVQADATQDFLNVVLAKVSSPDTAQLAHVRDILSGKITSRLYLEFLCKANHTDPLILERTKTFLNPQMSQHHQALSCANGFMQAGTSNDDFLRKNLDFLSHANNWAKFSAAASLGSIHRGQFDKSRELLKDYLPKAGVSASPYSEGGALFALGLIHANQGSDVFPYLLEQLSGSQSEIVQHGSCLGLGVSALATKNEAALEALKGILYSDNAIAGEAAGVSIGLLMLGSGDADLIDELLQYAHETQHEKIIRSIALGVAMILFDRQDQADSAIARMEADQDPILRYGAVWAVAMAYCGSSSNAAISKLLHFAVSDANDDVRRAAVTSLGFILFRNPSELPRLVELLTVSYNPSVRYGAAMALGIAFAGSANKQAVDLIMPMCRDFTDYVRQGAFIALSMIFMQHNDKSSGDNQVSALRKQLEQVVSMRHEDQLAKFGAILGQGILDAGGRNVRLALTTPSGHISVPAICGLAMFCQFWYWYPFGHFLSMSFSPTALIAVTPKLSLPKLAVISNAAPSMFAYPEATKPIVAAAPKKIVTAILSTTAKAAARAKKPLPSSDSKMSIDAPEKPETPVNDMEVDEGVQKTAQVTEAALPESNFETLDNLTRVVSIQVPLIQFPMDSRFKPVDRAPWNGSIIVLHDERPNEPFESHDKKPEAEPVEPSVEAEDSAIAPKEAKSPKLDI